MGNKWLLSERLRQVLVMFPGDGTFHGTEFSDGIQGPPAPVLAQSQPQSDLGAKHILVLHALESNVSIFELTDRGLRAALDAGGVAIEQTDCRKARHRRTDRQDTSRPHHGEALR